MKGGKFDMLIIGAGANGAGVALDASSRGLSCAVIDQYDFASGTSSRSTKMAHGGVRYFEQMMLLQGDPVESYNLLKETLNERNYFLKTAPYLNKQLPLLIPTPSFLAAALWYFPGCWMYHKIYTRELIKSEYNNRVKMLTAPRILSKAQLIEMYPDLKELHGQYGVLMSETQMIDSRMNLNSLFTATIDEYVPGMEGIQLANYVKFDEFVKDKDGKIIGAKLQDLINDEQFEVECKVAVNCAGVHADTIRQQGSSEVVNQRIQGARGTHIMFKKGGLPFQHGVIIPKTKDGRLIFIIDYMGHPMVGTTDEACDVTHFCQPRQEEIDFIIEELKPYFGYHYDYQNNLLAAWAGIRPLVRTLSDEAPAQQEQQLYNPFTELFKAFVRKLAKLKNRSKKGSTAQLARNHVIETCPNSGLVSLMGGKWTSYRAMGEETIDHILEEVKFPKAQGKQTIDYNLLGSYQNAFKKTEMIGNFEKYSELLEQKYELDSDVAYHLTNFYGTKAEMIAKNGDKERLHPEYPFIKQEIIHAMDSEMAVKPNDIICRRIPMAFLNNQIAEDLLPSIVQIMADHLNWSSEKKEKELKEALENLQYQK